MSDATQEQPDPRPGHYYVSACDHGRFWLLLGPFGRHQDALDRVDQVRCFSNEREPRSCFYGFGTCGLKVPPYKPGSCNPHLLSAEDLLLLATV